jgi:hypothetical protein
VKQQQRSGNLQAGQLGFMLRAATSRCDRFASKCRVPSDANRLSERPLKKSGIQNIMRVKLALKWIPNS